MDPRKSQHGPHAPEAAKSVESVRPRKSHHLQHGITRSLVNRVRYKKKCWVAGWIRVPVEHWVQSTCSTRTTSSALVDMVTWSLTQCGQRQLPPSMLCSLPCPPCIDWIEYAIPIYFCIFNIAHCIDGVDSGMPANPGHGPRVISSTCYVQSGEPVVILYHL